MSTLRVDAQNGTYEIIFQSDATKLCGEKLCELGATNVLIVSDENVAPHYLSTVQSSIIAAKIKCDSLLVPAGERSKNPEMLMNIYKKLSECGVNRSGMIVALGGGVIGDLAGYAAATYMRGIEFVQIPTTLLAQVDSSVGGKTGIDLPFAKNIVGAFHQPSLVLADANTLKTLPEREFNVGMAEVIKYGAIADENIDYKADMTNIVRRCCEIKAAYVKADPFDKGVRMELNFGHTLGHAVETVSNFGVLHGEGVAIGMCIFAKLGERLNISPKGTAQKIEELLRSASLPVVVPKCNKSELFSAMSKDKKGFGEQIHIVLLEKYGKAILHEMDRDELFAHLEELI